MKEETKMATLKLPSKATTAPTKPAEFVVEESIIQRLLRFPLDQREAAARRWFSGVTLKRGTPVSRHSWCRHEIENCIEGSAPTSAVGRAARDN